MKVKTLVGILIVLLLVTFLTSGIALADELTEEDIAADTDLKKTYDALKEDKTDKKQYDPDNYNCYHFSRDVQKALWNKGIETTIVKAKYTLEGEQKIKTHHLLKTVHKVDGKDVYIEPQADKMYKGLESALQPLKPTNKKKTLKESEEYPFINIDVKTVPDCKNRHITLGKLVDITVGLTDCNGKPFKNKDFTVEVTKPVYNSDKDCYDKPFQQKAFTLNGKTDSNGKWKTKEKIIPCPMVQASLRKHFKIKVTVPRPSSKAKDVEEICCKCTLGLQGRKTVWDSGSETWEESIYATVGDTVTFQLLAHNYGICNVTNIKVTDILPNCLEYAGNAAVNGNPQEPIKIGPPQYEWSFPGLVLDPGENITITFDAHVVECECEFIAVNTQKATAMACDGIEGSDEDTASVICVKEVPALTPLGLIVLIVILTIFLASSVIKRK